MEIQVYDKYGIKTQLTRDTDARQVQAILNRESNLKYGKVGQAFISSWIYAIISSIYTAVGSNPFGLYAPKNSKSQRFSTKNWNPIDVPEIQDRLDNPNPHQRWRTFAEQFTMTLSLTGNVWIYMDLPNSRGIPRSLLVFGPESVSPVRNTQTSPPEAWRIRVGYREEVIVPLDTMIHVKLPNPYDQWIGMPPCLAMDGQLDADRARVNYDRFFYKNKATPDMILTYKNGPLNEAARKQINESWYDAYGGEERAGGVAVLGGDFEAKVLGVNHSLSEYIANRKFTRSEAAAIYNYPSQLLNDLEGGGIGRDQLSVARQIKYENVIFPYCDRLAEAITYGFVRKIKGYQNIGFFPDYDGLPVMVDFIESKAKTMKTLTDAGVPLNNAIAKLDLGLDDVKGGDKGLVQGSLKHIDKIDDSEDKATADAAVESVESMMVGIKRALIDFRNQIRAGQNPDIDSILEKIYKRIDPCIAVYISTKTGSKLDPAKVRKSLKRLSYSNTIEFESQGLRDLINGSHVMVDNLFRKIDSAREDGDISFVFDNASKIAGSLSRDILRNCDTFLEDANA